MFFMVKQIRAIVNFTTGSPNRAFHNGRKRELQPNILSSENPNPSFFYETCCDLQHPQISTTLMLQHSCSAMNIFPRAYSTSTAIARLDVPKLPSKYQFYLSIFQNFQVKPFMFDSYIKARIQRKPGGNKHKVETLQRLTFF